MIKQLLQNIDFQKNKKIILIAFVLLAVLILGFSYCSRPVKNTAREDMPLNILAIGQLSDLNLAMKRNGNLRSKVREVLSYDEAYLFVNYRQVDVMVREILFLWAGITPKQIETIKLQNLAAGFIRHVYGFPKDEPIQGNPLLEDNPWADLFQKIKAKILMQGAGHKVYEGVAYYDSNNDKMIIQGNLSQEYAKSLAEFIATQPADKQKGFKNNYLLFVEHTLGFKNLSREEKQMLKELGYY